MIQGSLCRLGARLPRSKHKVAKVKPKKRQRVSWTLGEKNDRVVMTCFFSCLPASPTGFECRVAQEMPSGM